MSVVFLIAALVGLVGFALDTPISIVESPIRISLIFGSLLPLVLAIAWGWRAGLIAATLGLAAMYPFAVWPKNGWANLLTYFLLCFWFTLHGWAAERRSAGRDRWWHSPYIVELAYNLLYATCILTVFRWCFALNPAPWAADAETVMPMVIAELIAIKSAINGLVLVMMADTLLHLGPMRRLLRLPCEPERRCDTGIVSLGLAVGMVMMGIDVLVAGLMQGGWSVEIFRPDHRRLLSQLLLLLIVLAGTLLVAAGFRRRERIGQQLQASNRRLALALRGGRLGLWDWCPQTGAVIYDEMWARMLGYRPDEVEPRVDFFKQSVHSDDLQAVLDRLQAHIEGRSPAYVSEHRLRRKSGEWIWVHDQGEVAERDAEGHPIRVTGVIADITERIHADKDREALQTQLSQHEKMDAIGQLAGGIAHDFNNQLNGIIGFAELLKAKSNDAVLYGYAENILKASRRAATLTAQLLAFGRKGKNLIASVDMHKVIAEVVELLHRSIDKRIEIKQHLATASSAVLGDPTQLQNAVLNLALNARDAMPQGGVLSFSTHVVTLEEGSLGEELAAGQYLELCVTDTGIGMDAEVKNRLFEPFFTTKEVGKGTGLGLASVYGTMRNHHGAIRVDSEPGRGSSFHLYLPVHEVPDTATVVTPAAISVHGHGRILLVDDEPINLVLGSAMLRNLGYEVIPCDDPIQALERYQQEWRTIDLVLLDMIMPKLGGKQLFLAMKQENQHIRALLMSGFSIDGEAQAILDHGVLAFLQKPFELAELSRKVADSMNESAHMGR
jgi:PAS domain S-box-containing protein